MSEKFGRSRRVLRSNQFDHVYRQGRVISDRWLVVRGIRNGLDHGRLGLSVSRRVGSAVVRNRWKRLIREAFRRQLHRLPTGWDLVVQPRANPVPPYNEIAQSLVRLAERLASRG